MELGRLGIGEAAGVGLGPGEQGRRRGGPLFDLFAVDHQVELADTPGGFQPLHRHGEVLTHRQGTVDQRHVGQLTGKGGAEQPLLLERLEVLAVDPEQVDGAATALARLLVGQQLADALGDVVHLHLHQLDLVFACQLLAGPHQIGVDLRAAAPGVEVDGLPLGLLKGLLPLRVVGGVGLSKEKTACQQGQGAQQLFERG